MNIGCEGLVPKYNSILLNRYKDARVLTTSIDNLYVKANNVWKYLQDNPKMFNIIISRKKNCILLSYEPAIGTCRISGCNGIKEKYQHSDVKSTIGTILHQN